MSGRSAALAVAALLTAAVAGPGLVQAAGADVSPSTAWLTAGSSPLVELDGVYPGVTGDSQFEVANPRPQPVALSVRITDVVGDDNGCNRPETNSGDTTCGAGGGELEDDLIVAVVALDDDGTRRDLARGPLAHLDDEWADDPVPLARDEHRAYLLEYELPLTSTNLTQTDRVGFDLEVGLEQLPGAAPTAAVRGGGPATATLTGAALASSARPFLGPHLAGGMAAVVLAAALWRGLDRRRTVAGATGPTGR